MSKYITLISLQNTKKFQNEILNPRSYYWLHGFLQLYSCSFVLSKVPCHFFKLHLQRLRSMVTELTVMNWIDFLHSQQGIMMDFTPLHCLEINKRIFSCFLIALPLALSVCWYQFLFSFSLLHLTNIHKWGELKRQEQVN